MPIFKGGFSMWCNIQKNGTAVYRERYKDPLTGKLETVSVSKPKDTPQNKNKAQRELAAKIETAIQELQCNDKTVTLAQLQKEYLKAQRIIYKDSTVDRNESVTSSVIDILNPDAIVNNLTAQYVKSKLLESKSKIKTVNSYITRFKAMLNWGYENDYLTISKTTRVGTGIIQHPFSYSQVCDLVNYQHWKYLTLIWII